MKNKTKQNITEEEKRIKEINKNIRDIKKEKTKTNSKPLYQDLEIIEDSLKEEKKTIKERIKNK